MVTEFFDIAIAPSPAKARAGVDALGGPDAAGLHVYLGGHRCVASGWTRERIQQYTDAGIRQFLLTYVGDQRRDQLGEQRGTAHGRDAVTMAAALGWTRGAPLVVDIEASTYDEKPEASMEYVAGWCREVRSAGHRAGIYSSARGVTEASTLGPDGPDFGWVARWLGHERQPADPRKIKGLSAATYPRRGQRAWQYAGEGRAGSTRLRCRLVGLDVDLDVADDGLLVGPPGERPRLEALVEKARNDDVRLFQGRLRQVDGGAFAALNPSGVTGFYGAETVAMCRAFQKAQGWTGAKADGRPGVGVAVRARRALGYALRRPAARGLLSGRPGRPVAGPPGPRRQVVGQSRSVWHGAAGRGTVADGDRAPLARAAGITDVAARAGVSTATVSRALRGLPNVSDATRERVVRAAAELGYVASPSASSLASGRTMTVAVVTPYLARWFFAQMLEAVEQPLRAAGYRLLLYSVGDQGEDRRRAFDPAGLRKTADAVLVLNVPLTDDEIDALRELARPVALVGYQAAGFPSVTIDDVAAAETATRHLVRLGHTRIAHIGSRPERGLAFPTPVLRRRGYEHALRAAGLPVDPALHKDGDFTVDGGAAAMRELLALGEPPTAVFAGCDHVAFGAMHTARVAGLRVPDDVSVVGVDDCEMAALFELTTVAQPIREQGELVAGVLLRALSGEIPADTPPEVVVPTHLVVRASTAPPRPTRGRLASGGAAATVLDLRPSSHS